ncbi:Uncharacterised protein [Mycobacteroides abscessus subsp. abscessus]|nr:Uncharacterised protein [Mycobacteroides abscessus subsp. abscessus]
MSCLHTQVSGISTVSISWLNSINAILTSFRSLSLSLMSLLI